MNEVFIMTSVQIKKQETLIQQELALLQQKFPNWIFGYELDEAATDLVDVIKSVIKEIKIKFPNYKFSICKESYNSLLILKIRPVDKDEEFAYYGGNDCGYIVFNDMYRTITNEFKNHSDITLFDIRVFEYIDNSRTMELEFKKY
jgi:hypothetical protein